MARPLRNTHWLSLSERIGEVQMHDVGLLSPQLPGEREAEWGGGDRRQSSRPDDSNVFLLPHGGARPRWVRDQYSHIVAAFGLGARQPAQMVLDAAEHRVVVLVDVEDVQGSGGKD